MIYDVDFEDTIREFDYTKRAGKTDTFLSV